MFCIFIARFSLYNVLTEEIAEIPKKEYYSGIRALLLAQLVGEIYLQHGGGINFKYPSSNPAEHCKGPQGDET